MESLRLKYMGPTPRKKSDTGQAVIDRMLADESDDDDTLLMRDPSEPEHVLLVTAHDQDIYDLDDPDDAGLLHMGHIYSAVEFWNRIGRFTGARSQCVRDFMNDPNNYRIQLGKRNCQMAPRESYLPVHPHPAAGFQYIPRSSPDDSSNFDMMEQQLRAMGYS